MRILFSESAADYQSYHFPYAIWGFLEPGESPAEAFARGFLPSGPELKRFYMTRSARVRLAAFEPSSENRRILRKGAAFQGTLLPKEAFKLTGEREDFILDYAKDRFGDGVMDGDRLRRLLDNPVISHVLIYTDTETEKEAGLCLLYAADPTMVFYYFAFYDRDHPVRSLGAYMMTEAIQRFRDQGKTYLYQGTVYSKSALYKTQFSGFEFYNGHRWSPEVPELKYLLQRAETSPKNHLLEDDRYLENHTAHGLDSILPQAATIQFSEDSDAST